ncbi:hypothetical protein BI081_gp099 [Mycobacterium phage Tonenili]|uniref:Uncharacterized protein n=1 Tax=Mycobacterium phage Tonenili TaxID=1891703 RepID=A0A1C9EHR6_9CAUD|nr:hypothetical protein BI081_gp099 [Mycobacterium phage Tonenili]AON97008.1 hypothetical protein SEA_TONENILI_290 [Mycobacterium phage Tonenili]
MKQLGFGSLNSSIITNARDLNRLANGSIIRNECDTSAGPDQGVHFVKTPLGWRYSDPKGKPTTWELFPSDAIHLPVQVVHRVSEFEDVSEITENSPHTQKEDSKMDTDSTPSAASTAMSVDSRYVLTTPYREDLRYEFTNATDAETAARMANRLVRAVWEVESVKTAVQRQLHLTVDRDGTVTKP